jgi:hypothetical protein
VALLDTASSHLCFVGKSAAKKALTGGWITNSDASSTMTDPCLQDHCFGSTGGKFMCWRYLGLSVKKTRQDVRKARGSRLESDVLPTVTAIADALFIHD